LLRYVRRVSTQPYRGAAAFWAASSCFRACFACTLRARAAARSA